MDKQADEQRWTDWMLAAQAGDAKAYASLLEEIARALRAYLLARFGHAEFVDDCVQECLLAIHSARHTYQRGRPFRPWLFSIARHKAIDQLRRRQVREDRHEPLDDAQVAELLTISDGDAEGMAAGLLRRLPKQNREALILTKLAGYTTAEAAAYCGCSVSAMKVRVFRALRAARRLLDEDELDTLAADGSRIDD
ncbi:MAG: sigma-70 family RNA polymerase sigma factor [Pseudomonadota bacterium]